MAFVASDFLSSFEEAIVPLLAAVMFMMGLTLTKKDFKRISKEPKVVFIGV